MIHLFLNMYYQILFHLLIFYPSIVYILWSFLLIVGAMSVTDFTNLINVDVDMYLSFQLQMNQKERVISEF